MTQVYLCMKLLALLSLMMAVLYLFVDVSCVSDLFLMFFPLEELGKGTEMKCLCTCRQ